MICLSLVLSSKDGGTCEACPSSISKMGSSLVSFKYRGVRPSRLWNYTTCIRASTFKYVFPLKIKNGGIALPIAYAIKVVVVDLGDVTACGLLPGVAVTFDDL